MNSIDAVRLIERYKGAIRDLCGLIPEADRHYAEDDIATLEDALNKLSRLIEYKQKVDAATFHANKEFAA